MSIKPSDARDAAGKKLAHDDHSNRIHGLLADRDVNIPVWIRAPRNNSLEHYSGLSRAKLYELASEGFIRTVSIRKPGQVKGTRLFHLGSLLAFIAKHEAHTVTEEVGV